MGVTTEGKQEGSLGDRIVPYLHCINVNILMVILYSSCYMLPTGRNWEEGTQGLSLNIFLKIMYDL